MSASSAAMGAAKPKRGSAHDRRAPAAPICRCCGAALDETFADLGMTPLANSFIEPERAAAMEPFYPLRALVCSGCFLVQLAEFESPKAIFSDYLYFSSFSEAWLNHAAAYAERMARTLGLGPRTPVVEVASNDGYLLQYFAQRGIPVLGVDPAANVALTAIARGVPTEVAFFGAETARRLRAAHPAPALMVANNVLAHVPDLHDFVEGFRILLAPGGVATFEFPHLLRLMEKNEFDTIYHEHFSYISLLVAERLMGEHGLAARPARRRRLEAGDPRRRAGARRGARGGAGGDGGVPPLRRPRRRDQAGAARLPDRRAPGRQEGGRLRGAGEGQHPAELLRRREGAAALHGGPQHAQAGAAAAGQPHPHPRAGGDRGGEAGFRADPPLEPARRDRGADGLHPRLGRPLRRADPGRRGVLTCKRGRYSGAVVAPGAWA
jgi:SAM-dependent methyltransferase